MVTHVLWSKGAGLISPKLRTAGKHDEPLVLQHVACFSCHGTDLPLPPRDG